MITAKHFTYNGVSSQEYGLEIAAFNNDENVTESEVYNANVTTLQVPNNLRVTRGTYERGVPSSFTFSIVRYPEITAAERSVIISWLLSNKYFSPIKFFQDDLTYYTINGIFTAIESIFVNGRCQGFTLTVQPDSFYAKGVPTEVNVTTAGTSVVSIRNNSEIYNEYVYPVVTFTGTSVSITNITDDENRTFAFNGLTATEYMVVDCETKLIIPSSGGSKLSNFNKLWLRLRPGINQLRIITPGTVKVTCPTYMLFGL